MLVYIFGIQRILQSKKVTHTKHYLILSIEIRESRIDYSVQRYQVLTWSSLLHSSQWSVRRVIQHEGSLQRKKISCLETKLHREVVSSYDVLLEWSISDQKLTSHSLLTFVFAPFFSYVFYIKLLSNGVAPILTHLIVKTIGQTGFHSSAQKWTLGKANNVMERLPRKLLIAKKVNDMFVVYCFYYEVNKISNTEHVMCPSRFSKEVFGRG